MSVICVRPWFEVARFCLRLDVCFLVFCCICIYSHSSSSKCLWFCGKQNIYMNFIVGISSWQHPILFLRDVPFVDLYTILEFIYMGEVSIVAKYRLWVNQCFCRSMLLRPTSRHSSRRQSCCRSKVWRRMPAVGVEMTRTWTCLPPAE